MSFPDHPVNRDQDGGPFLTRNLLLLILQNHYSYRILQVPNVETRVLSKKHRRKIYYKGEDLPDLETGVEKHVETAVEKNCPNLTLEEFPLLPVTKNSIPETNCHQSVIVSMNSNGYAPPPGRIRFGSFECSTSKTVRLEMQEQSPRDGNGYQCFPN